MENLKMHTPDLADENFKKLAALFPNAVTETITGYKANGEPIIERAIDADVLRQEISATVVEGPQERYQFTWPDKKKSVVLANQPIAKTLRLDHEKSVGRDGTAGSIDTENIYIEGDNLDALKLLQETYLGKVKMIYIDPPYNRGKDYIYKDNFTQKTSDYLENSGQFDDEGNQMVQNTESNGRFHTDWLNIMYPRLRIAKDLLTNEGMIFISIDDNEVRNLKNLCDEIFGSVNFIAQLVWQNKKGGGNDSLHVAIEHEYILVYAKNKPMIGELYETYSAAYIKRYKEEDDEGKFFWDTFKRKSGKQYYPIICPDGTVLQYDEDGNAISWLRSKARFEKDIKKGEIRIIKIKDNWSVQFKQRMPKGKTPRSIFTTDPVLNDQGTTSTGANDVYEYFKKDVFSNPKPVKLIEFLLGFGCEDNDIVMDFFSGSGTTAEAVFRTNCLNKDLKFILIQVEENIDKMLTSSSADAKRIAQNAIQVLNELGKPHFIPYLAEERIRRAGKKIKKENPLITSNLDIGFRVFKVDSTNMEDVYYRPADYNQGQMELFADNIKPDRTPEDLLFQVMLDLGILLSSSIQETEISGKKVFSVADGYLIACFDKDVTEVTVKAIDMLPSR